MSIRQAECFLQSGLPAIIRKYRRNILINVKKQEESLDKVSGLFGEVLAELFAYKNDEWDASIRRMAFFLGKFVYLMDAYEDLEKDKKSGNYNPFVFVEQNEEYEEKCRSILSMMMAECSKEFEKLPIIHNIELLRNILYSGVWCRYEQLRMKKERLPK